MMDTSAWEEILVLFCFERNWWATPQDGFEPTLQAKNGILIE